MVVIKPDLTRVWASDAPEENVVDPDITTPDKYVNGWEAEVPTFQHFNFLQKTFTQGLAHNNEQGINVWDAETLYPENAIVKGSNGKLYTSSRVQSGNNPTGDNGSNWVIFTLEFDTALGFITTSGLGISIPAGVVVTFKGWASIGDGGGGKWKTTGNTIDISRSPSLTGSATLSDPNGNELTLITMAGTRVAEVYVAQLGALGGADDGLPIAAAIKSMDLLGGGIVHLDRNLYNTSIKWVANTGVLLKSPIRVDLGSNTNGNIDANTKTVVRWVGGSDTGTIFTIEPESTGQAIWGGGSENIEYDCNNLIARAVHLNTTKYSLFDGKVRNAISVGLLVSSIKGAAGIFSSNNDIRSLEYIWGTQPATQDSIGLLITGNGTDVPSTQQMVGRVTGLVYNGFLVQVEESDNCHFDVIHSVVQSGGTGGAIWFRDVGFGAANSNVVTYCVGRVHGETGLYGNTLVHYISEGGAITGEGMWDGELSDYVTGKRFKSHTYALRDKISITGSQFVSSSTDIADFADFAFQWATPQLAELGTNKLSCIIPNTYRFDNGVVEAIELIVGSNGTSMGNYLLETRLSTDVTASGAVTPERSVIKTAPAGAQYTPKTITFDMTDLPYSNGDHIFLTIERAGGDVADTNTDGMFILGARVLYKGTGPDSAGSGTYFIPEW